MKAPFSITAVVAIAVLHIVSAIAIHSYVPHHADIQPDSFMLYTAAIMIIPSLPFAYALPRMRVGAMWRAWAVPQSTYILSRPLLCLVGSSMIGAAIGAILSGIVVGWEVSAQGLILMPVAICFLYSAHGRCQRPASTEFAMSFWPRLFRFRG